MKKTKSVTNRVAKIEFHSRCAVNYLCHRGSRFPRRFLCASSSQDGSRAVDGRRQGLRHDAGLAPHGRRRFTRPSRSSGLVDGHIRGEAQFYTHSRISAIVNVRRVLLRSSAGLGSRSKAQSPDCGRLLSIAVWQNISIFLCGISGNGFSPPLRATSTHRTGDHCRGCQLRRDSPHAGHYHCFRHRRGLCLCERRARRWRGPV